MLLVYLGLVSRRSFETEQRKIYRGHDVLQNPKPMACKIEDSYEPPGDKIDTETSNRVRFLSY